MLADQIQNKPNPDWMVRVTMYSHPDTAKSWWQLINSVVPYFTLWVAMFYSLQISYWLTLFLAIFAAGFMVRIFIIFHDCGHGSFFKSKQLNIIVGVITGLIAFTPYHKWHRDHKVHHATVGNLDKRGIGDVDTLTVDEYLSLSKWKRFTYSLYRHPIFLFGVAPFLLFVVLNRLTKKYMTLREKAYVHLSNLVILSIILLIVWIIGLKAYLMIQIPIIYIASVHGVWLFYVQHQYENVVWATTRKLDYKTIALLGSSYFKLPRILQWFTGNIGFHHIHHLSPRIPNYNLEKCHNENPDFQVASIVTFLSSLRTLRLRLWNEKKQKMIGFKELRTK